MKVLQILKSEPDEIVEMFMAPLSGENHVEKLHLYREDADYDRLIELVFEHDKVVCWW